MRLVNVQTLKLASFFTRKIPPYAILSHTWESEELTFYDLENLSPGVESKLGYKKLVNACRQAENDGFDYLWIDTCCIDKSSSHELQESIVSMFEWYKRAELCYAYISDVERFTCQREERNWRDDFKKARW